MYMKTEKNVVSRVMSIYAKPAGDDADDNELNPVGRSV